MNDDPRELSIFLAAKEKENAEELRVYLDQACGANQQLRADVEALLAAHHKDNSFFERPPVAALKKLDNGEVQELDRNALNAGLAPTFGPNSAVIVGGAGHSVLKSLSKQLPRVPNVTLQESAEERNAVVQPGSPELNGKRDDSRYQLLGEIARGGMGAIIKGRDTDLGRDLAVKVLLDSHKDNPEVIQRFVEEAQIGGQLQHPGIVPVYELGQFRDQRPYFSMKLVKGKTLAALLSDRDNPSDDLPKFLSIFEQVCQTMAYAHSKGVIHRDLKPANIMVGAFGEVQVMDWGLSKVLSQGGVADEQRSLEKHQEATMIQTRRSVGSDVPGSVGSDTKMGSVMGTPAYMPPEQATGDLDRLDRRADVFGLGAILCEILTGKPPYVADEANEVLQLAVRGKLENCYERLARCNAEVDLISMTKVALSSAPDHRFADAGKFAVAITQYSEGVQERLKESEFSRVEAQARTSEERKRKKLFLALAGLMSLLAVAGIGFSIERARNLKNEKRLLANETRLLANETRLRLEAEKARDAERVTRIASQAKLVQQRSPIRSLRLASQAADLAQIRELSVSEAREMLLDATAFVGGKPLVQLRQHGRGAFSADGQWLVACGWYVKPYLLDLSSADVASSAVMLEIPGNGFTDGGIMSSDSRWFAAKVGDTTSESYNKICLWDLHSDKPTEPFQLLLGRLSGPINGFSFSANNQWIAATEQNSPVPLLWRISEEEIAPPYMLQAHATPVNAIAFSPDDRWLATAGQDGKVWLWDLERDPTLNMHELASHSTSVTSLAFNHDGSILVTGSTDGELSVWDMLSDDPSDPVTLPSHGASVNQLSFGPMGPSQSRLVSCASDGQSRLWELSADRTTFAPLEIRRDSLEGELRPPHFLFSPDGRWLFTQASDKTERVWELGDIGIERSVDLRGHQSGIYSASVSPDSRWLATGSADGTARLWDLQSVRDEVSSVVLRGHDTIVGGGTAFSPDSRLFLTGDFDGATRLWDLSHSNPASTTLLGGHQGEVTAALITSDNKVISAGRDCDIRIWNLAHENIPGSVRVLSGHTGGINSLAVNEAGRYLISGSDDNTARLWALTGDDPVSTSIPLDGHSDTVNWVAISPTGDEAATASEDGTVRLWKIPPNLEPSQAAILRADGSLANRVEFSPDGIWLGVSYASKLAQLWKVNTDPPQLAREIQIGNKAFSRFHALAWGETSQSQILAFGNKTSISVTKIERGSLNENILELKHTSVKTCAAVSADGRWVAATSWSPEFNCRLWDLHAKDPNAAAIELKGTDDFGVLAFSPDSSLLVAGSYDGTASVFELNIENDAESAELQPVMNLQGHSSQLQAVAFSPDNCWIVTAGSDGLVGIWDLNLDSLLKKARALSEFSNSSAGQTESSNE